MFNQNYHKISDLKSGNAGFSSEEGDGSESPAPVTLASNNRKDLDFTEQLWTMLKGENRQVSFRGGVLVRLYFDYVN